MYNNAENIQTTNKNKTFIVDSGSVLEDSAANSDDEAASWQQSAQTRTAAD